MSGRLRKPDVERPLIFDSWALMAFLEDEPSAEKVERLIVEAIQSDAPLLITAVNMGEIWYSVTRTRSGKDADSAVAKILNLGFKIVDVDLPLSRQASVFKSKYRLAFADCFSAALGKHKNSPIITGDKEFKQLEGEVEFEWV